MSTLTGSAWFANRVAKLEAENAELRAQINSRDQTIAELLKDNTRNNTVSIDFAQNVTHRALTLKQERDAAIQSLNNITRIKDELALDLQAAIQRAEKAEAACPDCGHPMRYHDNVDYTHGCVQCALKSALDRLQKSMADSRRLDWLDKNTAIELDDCVILCAGKIREGIDEEINK